MHWSETHNRPGELLALATHNESVQEKADQSGKKPNILVIWGDDIGVCNISADSDGLMGYTTPNIDRAAKEGIRFLYYYGEQSCTAGRAAFITGQHGIRTGLTKVGFPSAPMGMSQLDPSIGGLLKNVKYVFAEQRLPGTLGVWAEPFTKLRLQKIFNLFQDPYERADITSNTYWDWILDHI